MLTKQTTKRRIAFIQVRKQVENEIRNLESAKAIIFKEKLTDPTVEEESVDYYTNRLIAWRYVQDQLKQIIPYVK